MKNLKRLQFAIIALCAVPLLTACSDDETTEPGTDPTPPPQETGIFELASDGEQQDVTIPIAEPWEATSSANWLQLSQMGGKGGESVKVIAARNLTGRARTGYINFSNAPASRASADSTQIVVHQPANEEEDAPGVVLTEAYFENGGIFVNIYNGRDSESSFQELATASPAFSFTDPNASSPTKAPIIYVKKGETYKANPYVIFDENGLAEGKFSIAGEESVNKLRIKQNVVFKELGSLNNEGSAAIHFTVGDVIYYGGGIISHTSLGYEQTTLSYEFRSYNTATGEEKTYADIPESGAGTSWRGVPVLVGAEGVYILSTGKWQKVASRSDKAIAAATDGDKLYAVTAQSVDTYTLAKNSDGNITAALDGTNRHGETFNSTSTTTDGNGTTWILDNQSNKAYAISGGVLEPTTCPANNSLNQQFNFIGVANGYIYAFDGTSVIRYDAGSGTAEPLRMLGTFEWYGATECVNGQLYNFGGTETFRGTETASKDMHRFSPSDYAPISVAIMPE